MRGFCSCVGGRIGRLGWCEQPAGCAVEQGQALDGFDGHAGVDLGGLNAVEDGFGDEGLEGWPGPMEAHVPVAFARGGGSVSFVDCAWDTCLNDV